MKTDDTVRKEGMKALIENLGVDDAERFVVLMNRPSFDYTEWRHEHFMDLREFSRPAAEHAKNMPESLSSQITPADEARCLEALRERRGGRGVSEILGRIIGSMPDNGMTLEESRGERLRERYGTAD